MRIPTANNGFRPARPLGRQRRTATFAELVATVGLTLSTLVAVTVVTAGIARADVATSIIDNESGLFALALVIGVAFLLMGGFTLLTLPRQRHRH